MEISILPFYLLKVMGILSGVALIVFLYLAVINIILAHKFILESRNRLKEFLNSERNKSCSSITVALFKNAYNSRISSHYLAYLLFIHIYLELGKYKSIDKL